MQRAPALCGLVRFAGVQADLEAGRAVHHPWAVRAEALEGVFHRGVARDGEDAARGAEGVQAVVARNEARIEKESRELGRVGGGVIDQLRDRVRRGAGDLYLSTGLHGDQGAPAERQLRAVLTRVGGACTPRALRKWPASSGRCGSSA